MDNGYNPVTACCSTVDSSSTSSIAHMLLQRAPTKTDGERVDVVRGLLGTAR